MMNEFAPAKRISSFHPPQRTLMGPGPTEIHPRVLTTMSQPAIGYLDPVFVEMMEELKVAAALRLPDQESAHFSDLRVRARSGMEYCFVNLVAPGDKVIVCRNGVFGGRMIENVERCGGDAGGRGRRMGRAGRSAEARRCAEAASAMRVWWLLCMPKRLLACCRMRRRWSKSRTSMTRSTIVDAVTSLGGSPVLVDEWHIDAVYSASQKCLSCTPGLSPVSFSERVVDYVKARKDKIHRWFMDMNLLLGYWGATTRTYHHTAPTNSACLRCTKRCC